MVSENDGFHKEINADQRHWSFSAHFQLVLDRTKPIRSFWRRKWKLPLPGFLKGSFSAWKQAENAHFWKQTFSPRDKRWSETCAWNYRPCFRENQPKRSFSIKWKRAFWACFRENWVYKFGHWVVFSSYSAGFRPHQTKTLILVENLKTTPTVCFQLKRAN